MAMCGNWEEFEHCKFCGQYFNTGSNEAACHYNSHIRQFCTDTQNMVSCSYEQPHNVQNSGDIETGFCYDQNFQYSYTSQGEPPNMDIQCSPLNLTGRSKVKISPISSPIPNHNMVSNPISSPIPNHNIASNLSSSTFSQIANDDLNNFPVLQQSFNNFESCIPSCSETIHNSAYQSNLALDYEINQINNDCYSNKEKLCDSGNEPCCQKLASQCDETNCPEINETIPSSCMLGSDPVDLNQSIPDAIPYSVPPKPYKCSICNEEFCEKEELSNHLIGHNAAKPYNCTVCGIGLSNARALKRHSLSHTGLKPHSCDICNRKFCQKFDLQRHYSVHTKKVFSCSTCNKNCPSEYQLKTHKCKLPRPFKCKICGEGCTTSVAWSYHMWKHTKNPAFVPCQKVNSDQNTEKSNENVSNIENICL